MIWSCYHMSHLQDLAKNICASFLRVAVTDYQNLLTPLFETPNPPFLWKKTKNDTFAKLLVLTSILKSDPKSVKKCQKSVKKWQKVSKNDDFHCFLVKEIKNTKKWPKMHKTPHKRSKNPLFLAPPGSGPRPGPEISGKFCRFCTFSGNPQNPDFSCKTGFFHDFWYFLKKWAKMGIFPFFEYKKSQKITFRASAETEKSGNFEFRAPS